MKEKIIRNCKHAYFINPAVRSSHEVKTTRCSDDYDINTPYCYVFNDVLGL